MLRAKSFTFGDYKIDPARGIISFTYRLEFSLGIQKTFTDKLYLHGIPADAWSRIPDTMLKSTLEALLIMLGINYWCIFPTRDIRIRNFTLTREQAHFWNELYLNGLGEFFYAMKMDFRNLINFPYDESVARPMPARFPRQERALLLNGAGKDSILSAEILKASRTPFDFFAFAPTPAHDTIAYLVGARTIRVTRARDRWAEVASSFLNASSDYPSVSTFTFIATLLAELLDYDSIIFSNERSADFGNLNYLGLEINHQWCKSSVAEKMINDYIRAYISPDISTRSLLRQYSELEIVKRFIEYPQYLHHVTSCNNYFWLPRFMQGMSRGSYWCKKCPKCVFLFACFTAFLPREKVLQMFGADLYTDTRLLPLFQRILGLEGFKPLDCVGEPEEMILAMHYARKSRDYAGSPAIEIFEKNFPPTYDFTSLEQKVFIHK